MLASSTSSGKPGDSTRIPPKTDRGFTIVEILVVIAIMAVLTAIIFPVAGKMKQRSIDTKCANNQRQVGSLFPLYAAENNGLYPFVTRSSGEEGGEEKWHVDLLAPYTYPQVLNEQYPEKFIFREESMFRCPAAKDDLRKRGAKFIEDERLGYGMNESLPGRGSATDRYQAYSEKVPGNIDEASQACLIMDADEAVVGSTHRKSVKPVIGRHSGKVNVLFVDGSNDLVDYDDIPFSGSGTPGTNSETNRFWFGTP